MRQNRSAITFPVTFYALLFIALATATDAYLFGNSSKFISLKI